MGEPGDLLSLADVARLADISVSTVYRRVREGILPVVPESDPARVRLADLLTFMNTPLPPPPPPTPAEYAGRLAASIERFWAKVDKTGTCWLWRGAVTPKGYGMVAFMGQQTYAHRLAYEITYGPFMLGLFVCHKCDVPACVRPDHLFLGTPADNSADMVRKGRTPKTRRPYTRRTDRPPRNAKLTADQAAEIRTLYAAGMTQVALAAKFGVSHTSIYFVLKDITYRCGKITYRGEAARRISELEEEVARLRKALGE
jgi:hypothetical protein